MFPFYCVVLQPTVGIARLWEQFPSDYYCLMSFFAKGFGKESQIIYHRNISCRGAAPATLQGAFLPLHPSLGACGPKIPR